MGTEDTQLEQMLTGIARRCGFGETIKPSIVYSLGYRDKKGTKEVRGIAVKPPEGWEFGTCLEVTALKFVEGIKERFPGSQCFVQLNEDYACDVSGQAVFGDYRFKLKFQFYEISFSQLDDDPQLMSSNDRTGLRNDLEEIVKPLLTNKPVNDEGCARNKIEDCITIKYTTYNGLLAEISVIPCHDFSDIEALSLSLGSRIAEVFGVDQPKPVGGYYVGRRGFYMAQVEIRVGVLYITTTPKNVHVRILDLDRHNKPLAVEPELLQNLSDGIKEACADRLRKELIYKA